jgi:hypothetical protein
LYTIKAPLLGIDQILYPVAAAFSHRSIAFHHHVLCWVLVSMYGKNSGEILAAPYVQYQGEKVFATLPSISRVEIIFVLLVSRVHLSIADTRC